MELTPRNSNFSVQYLPRISLSVHTSPSVKAFVVRDWKQVLFCLNQKDKPKKRPNCFFPSNGDSPFLSLTWNTTDGGAIDGWGIHSEGIVPNSIGTLHPVKIAPKWATKTNRYIFNVYSILANRYLPFSHYYISPLSIQRCAAGDKQ